MSIPDYLSLRRYCYFSTLSDAALKAISERLEPVSYSAGTMIVKEGARPGSFYLLRRGEVLVTKRTRWEQEAPLSVLGTGECFGEMALLTCSPRSCTVSAGTDVDLFRLGQADFEEIVRMDATFSEVVQNRALGLMQWDRFRTLQPFALLPSERMAALAGKLTERRFSPGEAIIREGEQGNLYYVMKSGEARVLRASGGDLKVEVDSIQEGEGFGEEALITGAPRNATVQAKSDVAVWTLERGDFEQIMKASFLEEVFPEDVMQKDDTQPQVFLDVRLAQEFEEEHIPQAVNVPFNELRHRYPTFPRDHVYYVYCLQGVRSASAAFLMNSNGYTARSIKGGIHAWPGTLETGPRMGVHTPTKPT